MGHFHKTLLLRQSPCDNMLLSGVDFTGAYHYCPSNIRSNLAAVVTFNQILPVRKVRNLLSDQRKKCPTYPEEKIITAIFRQINTADEYHQWKNKTGRKYDNKQSRKNNRDRTTDRQTIINRSLIIGSHSLIYK